MYLRNDDAGLPRHLFLWKKTISVIYFELVFVALGMQSGCVVLSVPCLAVPHYSKLPH